ncbi:hypothetical protein C1645_815849 [Glomus cerebriforme]|uniref:Uncharacterized protein n=1 Tax=Glomus cerebriforme TaxID=658196 RepID=A0A397TD88_9GLOM|nr:hypothetical protein C1645_815849 [Glomus cerebriforme]
MRQSPKDGQRSYRSISVLGLPVSGLYTSTFDQILHGISAVTLSLDFLEMKWMKGLEKWVSGLLRRPRLGMFPDFLDDPNLKYFQTS